MTIRIALTAGIALTIVAPAGQAATIWQNDWLIPSPITLQQATSGSREGKPSQAIAFGADHERVIAAPSPNSLQYMVM